MQSANVLPKLQRIPRPDDPTFLTETNQNLPVPNEFPEILNIVAKPEQLPETPKSVTPPPQTNNENKSIVGSVTTWLPHNSKIVDSQQNCEGPIEAPRPQCVEFLAGRKFLVIPKHNFMSVSPTVAASAVSRVTVSKLIKDSEKTVSGNTSENLAPDPDLVTKPTLESPAKPENSQTPESMEVEESNHIITRELDAKINETGKISAENEE